MATKKTTTGTTRKTTAKPAAKPASRAAKSATKTTAKASAKPAPRPAPRPAAPVPPKPAAKGVTLAEAGTAPAAAINKKALFERVKKRAVGVKGREIRVVMEAVLAELGAALGEGDTLKLQPMGTIKVQRRKEVSGGEVVVCRLRRKKPGPGADPLASAAE